MKLANPISTAVIMPSRNSTPMLTPLASGESLWPKQTGHARTTRGAATRAIVATARTAFRTALTATASSTCVENRAVDGQRADRQRRHDCARRVRRGRLDLILRDRPGSAERRQHGGYPNEEQMKGSK